MEHHRAQPCPLYVISRYARKMHTYGECQNLEGSFTNSMQEQNTQCISPNRTAISTDGKRHIQTHTHTLTGRRCHATTVSIHKHICRRKMERKRNSFMFHDTLGRLVERRCSVGSLGKWWNKIWNWKVVSVVWGLFTRRLKPKNCGVRIMNRGLSMCVHAPH